MVTAGIVLAGGRSSRMGRDKGALPWHGSTLLNNAVETLLCTVSAQVVVVASQDHTPWTFPPRVRTAVDDPPGCGPLGALATGLEAAAGCGAEIAVVCGVDTPLMTPSLFRLLVESLGDADLAIPVAAGRTHPIPCAVRLRAHPAVRALVTDGQRAIRTLANTLATATVGEQTIRTLSPDLRALRNLNDRHEYESAHALAENTVTGPRLSGSTP